MVVQRLFVSLPLPAGIREALGPSCRRVRASVPARSMAWTDPATWHVTLRFLGDVDTSRIPDLESRLKSELNGIACFEVECRGLDWLPGPRRPRVLFAGVRAEPGRLETLQERVTRATAGFGAKEPERGFVAHATLARVRDPRARGVDWSRLVEADAHCSFGRWTLDACHLMASELRPEGARHTELSQFPLSHPAAGPPGCLTAT